MPELQLRISDSPRYFYCTTRESVPIEYSLPEGIKFPCYIEDFGAYWQVRVNGDVVYLSCCNSLALYKDIYANLTTYGLGLKSLKDIDSLPLKYLDNLKLGFITFSTANWLGLSCGTVGFVPLATLGDYDSLTFAELDARGM